MNFTTPLFGMFFTVPGIRSWVERARLFQHDRDTTLKMMEISGRASKLNHGRYTILKGVAWDEDLFFVLIDCFGKAGNVQEAVNFFQKRKELGVERTTKSYDTLFKVILRPGRYMMAKKYFHATMGQIDDGMKLFEEMISSGIKPNAVTYSTLLPGLCDAVVNLDAAADVHKAMIRLSIPTEAGHYGALIENLCKANVYDRAVSLLDNLIEKEIILRPQSTLEMEPSAYNPMILCRCNHGQSSKAEKFFWQLMKMVFRIQLPLLGHSKEGKPDSAFEIPNNNGKERAS
ncbi:Pentatricopeptide repeat-containing protein [Quillaja saponaria]|uniref:Pentatricopeptide repeat-containing protein n=1 Tax=Quillaja saponaria TaxID=32244 RepID=A0AAD7Q8T5_QUISA|nr:Pentatricopeptide repeat-containing protein [Quillaja saponaria]